MDCCSFAKRRCEFHRRFYLGVVIAATPNFCYQRSRRYASTFLWSVPWCVFVYLRHSTVCCFKVRLASVIGGVGWSVLLGGLMFAEYNSIAICLLCPWRGGGGRKGFRRGLGSCFFIATLVTLRRRPPLIAPGRERATFTGYRVASNFGSSMSFGLRNCLVGMFSTVWLE